MLHIKQLHCFSNLYNIIRFIIIFNLNFYVIIFVHMQALQLALNTETLYLVSKY